MNLDQLRALVLDTEHLSGETEVRMAQQPSYPLQTTISDWEVVGCDEERIDELEEAIEGSDLSDDELTEAKAELHQLQTDGNQTSIVYLAEGGQVHDNPYLGGIILKKLGWR